MEARPGTRADVAEARMTRTTDIDRTTRVGTLGVALGAVVALSLVAFVLFAYVAIHELGYASDHPYAYGPAKVIATGAGAGALLSLAVAVLGRALLRRER
jgi:hypothetical protein